MFIVNKMPQSLSAESYRSIRTSIKYSSVDNPIKTIVITSSNSSEGKSTVAGNLAFSLSQNGSRTLLIDCDLRKNTLHKYMGLSNKHGLTDALLEYRQTKKLNVEYFHDKGLTDVLFDKQDLKEVIKKIENNLYVLPCGTIPPNPAEILGSKTMEEFLDELSINYDYIILDTPPVLAVTDAQLLAAKADATVLVVKANKTKGKTVINSYKELEKVKANIIGTILNDYDNSGERLYYRHESDKKISKFLRKFKR